MKKATILFTLFSAILTAFTSCDSSRVFDQFHEISGSAWHKDSLIVFHVPVSDTLGNHNLFIQIRNETNYKYSNLWLFIEINQPGGEVLRDTFEIVVADPSGRWMGEGFGGIKTLQMLYRRDVFFPVSGEYTISVQHGMREEVLTGIHDVGIRVEKTGGT